MPDLMSIRNRHADLYLAFSQKEARVLTEAYRADVRRLIGDICGLASNAESLDDYLWLRNLLDQWRTASSVLKLPVDAILTPPSPDRLHFAASTGRLIWSNSSLEQWLKKRAFMISRVRALEWKAQLPSEEVFRLFIQENPNEANRLDEDWAQAEIYLAAEVIDGRMDLATSIAPDSYSILEGQNGGRWLMDVKRLKAYLRWRNRGGGFGGDAEDYEAACSEIRTAVCNPARKAPQSAFEPIQRYIGRQFLNPSSTLAATEKRVMRWLDAKASVSRAGVRSSQVARQFMTDFYENISQAVMGVDAESTNKVLEALGLRPGFEHNDAMVNCFEMAVAISFLDDTLAAQAMAR